MRTQAGTAGRHYQAGNKRAQDHDLRLGHKLLRYCTKLRLCHCILGTQDQYAMADEYWMSRMEKRAHDFLE
jgi:predicted GIY-YIG superfamily endonuclease